MAVVVLIRGPRTLVARARRRRRRRTVVAINGARGDAGAGAARDAGAARAHGRRRRLVVGAHRRRLVRRQQLRLGQPRRRARAHPSAAAAAALARPRAAVHRLVRSLLSSSTCAADHVRVATADDPATARFDERLSGLLRAHGAARNSEARGGSSRRAGASPGSSSRLRSSPVITCVRRLARRSSSSCGRPMARSVVLEAVNYFEHWGLARRAAATGRARRLGHRLVVDALHAHRPVAPRRSSRRTRRARSSGCVAVEESPKLPGRLLRDGDAWRRCATGAFARS